MKLFKHSFDGPKVEIIDSKIYLCIDEDTLYVLYKPNQNFYDVEKNEMKIGVMDKYGHIFLKED